MSNWYGTSRSNYVRVKDVEQALAALEPFSNNIHRHPTETDAIMISGDDDTGDFSTQTLDDDGDEMDLDWGAWAREHLKQGQILVLISAGAEKLRYVSAWAEAYNDKGDYVCVDLARAIDERIADVFGAPYADPQYQEVL